MRENANALKEKLISAMCNLLQKENDIDDQLIGEGIFKKTVNMATIQTVQANKELI